LPSSPTGHGETRATYADYTYWDSALANLQVLEALNVPNAFVLGTSQGGWIAARMAMLAPDTVNGIVPLGTSMDYESQRSRDLGCWDGVEFCTPAIDALAEPVDDDWVTPTELVDAVLAEGLGEDVDSDTRSFWHAEHQRNYTGDAGRPATAGSRHALNSWSLVPEMPRRLCSGLDRSSSTEISPMRT
jgi:pimeloyl-ACP methyl ester carboxylesterase